MIRPAADAGSMALKVRVRHAEPADRVDVAPLLCLPRPGLVELAGSRSDALRVARALFASNAALESHRYTWVVECAEGLVGAAVAVPGDELAASRVRTGLTMCAAAPWRVPWIVGRGTVLDRLTAPVPRSATFLSCLAVREGFRGLGIGRMLLQTVLAAVAHDGGRRVCLDVGIANERARRFYDRIGFHESSRERATEREQAWLGGEGVIRLERAFSGLDPVSPDGPGPTAVRR